MRVGSLFSGAAGLDRAVEEVFGATVAWQCEYDTAASKVLAHRYPGIHNFGDVTTINWDSIAPVDILCGGYPCQPFSAAGQRKGTDDERHLWPYFAEAIRRIRPRYVVLENVAGHRSMGFGSVLGDLADCGYDAQWCSVRASDVGAPHRRERLFVLAHPAGDGRECLNGGPGGTAARGGRQRITGRGIGCTSIANSESDGRNQGRSESAGQQRGSNAPFRSGEHVDLFPTPKASDGVFGTPRTSGRPVDKATHLGTIVSLLPTPGAADGSGGHLSSEGHQTTLPGVVRDLLPTPRKSDGDGGPNPLSRAERMDDVETRLIRCEGRWGKYEPAIRRWERVTRPAPSPTEPNTKGNPRLNPEFSSWMMGWPEGWVTDVPGISRNDQLRIAGNGVVVQQATAALRWLLEVPA